jgi:two-component sensor histidine kinase
MYKILLIGLILFLSMLPVAAQVSADKLRQHPKDIDSSYKLMKQAEELSIQLKDTKSQANIYLVAGSVMLFLLLGALYNHYRLKQQSNKQLQSKQQEINRQNMRLQRLITEKDWLLKEVHHRVKNNLQIVMSLLSTQLAYLENTAALNAISESRNRVQAISLIHQKLYSTSNVASIDMQTYISDLINYLNDCLNASSRGIRFEQLVEPIKIDLAQAVPLGLILNEAITNAVKYAFTGHGGDIIIALQLMINENLLLTITDNGKGLPANFDIKNTSSLGMEMMKALSKQLDGSFQVKSNHGVTITIEFQIEKVLNHIQAESFYS